LISKGQEEMARIARRISDFCARLTKGLIVILGLALVLCLLIAIFFRYVVGQALSWPEELSMLLFAWLVLLTSSLGVREGFHVRLTIIFNLFPPPFRKVLSYAIVSTIVAFGAVLFYSGRDLVIRTAGNLSATLGYPLEIINSSAPVCGALIVVHALDRLLAMIRGEEKP